ncbi:cyclin-D3-1-like [Camellia sinensis]|uniref:cyclin-D3-1-like n=1 Tax=Camellia sinensis TaxID=4442 RepID=UPI001035DC7C|nr:cyclin-D3-1-like [Camellia sinensis]
MVGRCKSVKTGEENLEFHSICCFMVEESKFVFEAKIIQRMELLVLSTLQWKMNSLTPLSFVDHIVRRFGFKTDLHLEFLWRCMIAQSLDLFDKS